MCNKVAELAICLEVNCPDILIGTESWLSENISNSEIFPSNYSVIRKDRPLNHQGQRHGGVFICARNDIIMSHRADLDSECKVIWAQLELVGSKRILLGAFYRPQTDGSEVIDELHSSLSNIDLSKNQIRLAGDFNLSHIDWENRTNAQGNTKLGLSKQLLDMANDFGLDQVVREPTRGENILDLFFTSNPSLVENVRVVPGMSDHGGIPVVTINSRPKLNKSKPRKVYQYHKKQIGQPLSQICLT